VRIAGGKVRVEPDEPVRPDVSLRTDPYALNALLAEPATLDDAINDGRASVEGDLAALRRLLRAINEPYAPARRRAGKSA
jgi:hypothetical protein